MPDMIDSFGGDHPQNRLRHRSRFGFGSLLGRLGWCLLFRRLWMRVFLEDAADGGGSQMEAGSAENLGDLLLSQGGAKQPQLLNKVADVVGKLVGQK